MYLQSNISSYTSKLRSWLYIPGLWVVASMGVLAMVLEVEVVGLTLLLDGVEVFADEAVVST